MIGSLPVMGWYATQLLYYSQVYANQNSVNQSLGQISTLAAAKFKISWYYLLEILAWPWLVFFPQSAALTWENRNLSWAKLIIVWSGVYLLLICLLNHQISWYLFPIYPSVALAAGFQLAETENLSLWSTYPRAWVASLAILAVVASGGSIYFSWGMPNPELQVIFITIALTMTLAAILAERGDGQFLKVLFWGIYISLLLLMKSNYWLWELAEAYPVRPVAAMITRAHPPVREIYTSFPYNRSSLDFYSDRQIIPATLGELQYYWQYHGEVYFLIDKSALAKLQLDAIKVVDQAEDWQLITKAEEAG